MRMLLLLWMGLALTPSVMALPASDETSPTPTETRRMSELASQLSGQLSQAKDKASDQATSLITRGMDLLGVPYKRGGNNESTGFDCSGFVRYLYEKSVGQVLPRRAEEQARATETIAREELKPGDLVFFNTMKRAFSHVGVYLGDGKFIHAPRTGKSVKIEDMREAYWQKRFNGARRVPLDSDITKP